MRYEVEGAVATVTIDRAERRNALTWSTVGELRRAVGAAKADGDVRALVLTGAGDRAFCAGADLSGMADGAGWLDLHDGRGQLAELFRDLWALGKPTVARVRGYAVGGGFGLALACDLVVAGADAVFAAPEVDVGLWPYMITVPMLRSMPPKVALELMMTGRRVGAEEGLRIGFVNRAVAVHDLDAAVTEMADALASKSPSVMRLGRDSFYAVCDLGADAALRVLHPMLAVAANTEDAAEGRAAFKAKRPPEWTGR